MEWRIKCGLSLLLLLASCAEYQPSSAPAPKFSPHQIVTESHGYAVAADPFVDLERQKTYFDADFRKAGIIGLQVLVQNRTTKPVLVRRSTMMLTLPDGRKILPSSAHSAAVRVGEEGSVVGATLAFGIIGGLMASNAEDAARGSRISDYDSKEFKRVTLGRDESAHGFVFFIPPPGTGPFNSAQLMVRFVDVDTATSKLVTVDLTGLHFPGRALASVPRDSEFRDQEPADEYEGAKSTPAADSQPTKTVSSQDTQSDDYPDIDNTYMREPGEEQAR